MELSYEEKDSLKPLTLYQKIFNHHVVREEETHSLIYIDRHLVHEVTSPQAFEGLRNANRSVRRVDCTLATVDHNVPTSDRSAYESAASFIKEKDSLTQVLALEENVKEFGLTYYGLDDNRQGIVHVIGPEQGFTLPGTTVVCGDSHTSTHGAFGALAFGIGTSEVEHVLATQTLVQSRSKNMRVCVDGEIPEGVASKDVILHIIGVIGTAGGTGHVIEFCGSVIEKFSIEARMSMCNMSIEAGARAGLVAPDETTFEYIKGRPLAPKGSEWENAVSYWKSLRSDAGAVYDKDVLIHGSDIIPTVTWGTSPQDVSPINGFVPDPETESNPQRKSAIERSLKYMGLTAGMKIKDIKIDKVFIGSCTNGRIEDLRAVATVAKGRKVVSHVTAMIVPGSGIVKKQAEAEGLDIIFKEAGFEWREPGCSMCLAMNPDKLLPGERCAATSNRNFEGRQGAGGRTHLVSPAMAAAAAVTGFLTDVRELTKGISFINENKLDSKKFINASQNLPKLDHLKNISAHSTISIPPSAAGMRPFTILKGIAAPFEKMNIDTDMIIPKQFLKTIKKTGLGGALFHELRSNPDGSINNSFVLNTEPYKSANILITGANFGCGSSREHAPWALLDFGIWCVIAPSFADIFYNNCFKNGMLPVQIGQEEVDILMIDAKEGKEIEINLHEQKIIRSNGEFFKFEVDAFRKYCLLNGFDDIGLTLLKVDDISSFEKNRSLKYPWLDGEGWVGGKN